MTLEVTLQARGLLVTAPEFDRPVLLPKGASDDEQGQQLLSDLQNDSIILAEFIEQGTQVLVKRIKRLGLVPPWRLSSNKQHLPILSDTETNYEKAMTYGDIAWNKDKSGELQITLLGWDREALIEAVWNNWAGHLPMMDTARVLLEISEHTGRNSTNSTGDGPSIAQWLAEMDEQGKLHQPGPQVHDIDASISVMSNRRDEAEAVSVLSNPIAKLLPNVPNAAKGLKLIGAQVMISAEQHLKAIRPKS